MRCYRCSAFVHRYQVCKTCGYEDKMKWWEVIMKSFNLDWVLIGTVFTILIIQVLYFIFFIIS